MTHAMPQSAKVYLWCAYPEDYAEKTIAERCLAWLQPEEMERWERYRSEELRREFLAAHALLRTALSQEAARIGEAMLPQEAWSFRNGVHGKPHVDSQTGLRFNLATCADLVVCAVTHGAEVGVDAEPITRAADVLELAPEVFSPLEVQQMNALQGPQKLERALSLWTLKESYIKACGMGLALPLEKFSFRFGDAGQIQLETDAQVDANPARWKFCELRYAAHNIALMLEYGGTPELQFLELRPWKSEPLEIATVVEWHG